jgi:hypothetical protein
MGFLRVQYVACVSRIEGCATNVGPERLVPRFRLAGRGESLQAFETRPWELVRRLRDGFFGNGV